jgi:uncharacterized protein (UPF0333 family)
MTKKNSATKPSSQRKLTFNDSQDRSNISKQDVSHIDDGPTVSVTKSKRRSQQNVESYTSPQKKRITETTTAQNVVTPDFGETKKGTIQQSDDSNYTPSYIHKNVEYVGRSQIVKLSPIQSKVLRWIEDNCEIPSDFEQNRKFGPLSGSSYADRVITAYRLGSLKRMEGSDHDDERNHDKAICTVCAELGHIADACPTLL